MEHHGAADSRLGVDAHVGAQDRARTPALRTACQVDVAARRPPAGACLAVAGLLGAASYVVGAEARVLPRVGPPAVRRAGVLAVAGVLLARGVAGPVVFGRVSERTERFRRQNLRYYSPLCTALGAGAAAVAWRGSSATKR
ncbi:DUF3995 domain-containing protein [Kitasatospora sp. NPDC058063]|uniref:DUF3995 domain-containing protein n=1 Tax=unclassified Kitasatospora TaxID=2633591 RepID=UPI0036DD9D18